MFLKTYKNICLTILTKIKYLPLNYLHTMDKPNILVTRPDFSSASLEMLKQKCNLTIWHENSPAPRDFILKNIANKNGLLCFLTDKIDSELLDAAGPNLTVVSTFSVGYDHIDVAECKKRNIKIGYTPDVLTEATAELTLGLLLCTSRRLIEASHEAKSGGWKTWAPSWMTGPGLAESTVGIVGFGRIGQSVAKKIKAFNASKILYYNRTDRPEQAAKTGAEKADMNRLLIESDFIICCCALTKETFKMFNDELFSKMKQTAIFINTSRGDLVDQEALIRALNNKKIRGAGLDVTSPEPLLLDSPLLTTKNCVVFPHIGSATIEARDEMAKLAAANLIAALDGTPLLAELQ